MIKRWVGLMALVLAGCSTATEPLPTLMVVATLEPPLTTEATAEAAPTQAATPTIDFAAMEATSQTLAQPIQAALEGLADLQGVRSVSVLVMDEGAAVNIGADIAPADDVEDTMNRVLAAVQGAISSVSEVRVTSYVDNIPQRNWLWEGEGWSSLVIGG